MKNKYAEELRGIYERLDGTLLRVVQSEKNGRWIRDIHAPGTEELFRKMGGIIAEHYPHLHEDPDFSHMQALVYILEHHPESEILLGYRDERKP